VNFVSFVVNSFPFFSSFALCLCAFLFFALPARIFAYILSVPSVGLQSLLALVRGGRTVARNLWRPSRFGVPVPVIAIVAVIVVLLVLVVIWVRGGCQKDSPEQPDVGQIPASGTLISPAPGPDTTAPSLDLPPAADQTTAPAPPPEPTIYDRYWDAGRKAFDQGDYVHARQQLSQSLKGLADESSRKMIQVQLNTIANELTFSSRITPGDTTVESYSVKPGDLPSLIARKYNISPALFLKINNIPNDRSMRAGKTYKVIKGPFNVVIDKKAFRLDVYLADFYIRSYPIGLGVDNSTPTGTFVAGPKLTEPTWFGVIDPTTGRREAVPYNDPRNPLGGYWITLMHLPQDGGKKTDYGIHGTNEPETIGRQASHGCIRMRNQDVAQLFDLLAGGQSRITVITD